MPEPHAHEGRGWTAAGYAGLAIYAAVAFSLRNHQTFVDEGSNLNLGWCVRHGLHLYRDVFENHFPLPVYFSAAVIAAVGTSLAKVRLAVFVLDTVMFVWIARATRLVFAVGLSAAVWALISPYYLGNLLLYDNFAMLGALGLGTATFAALTRGLPASRSVCALLAVSSLLAALSSVFFGLSSAIALASLWFAPGMPRRRLLAIVALIAAPVAAYGAYLTASGALGYFYQYTVVFNATTYQRYMTTSLARDAAKQIVLFDVLSPRWREALSPVRFARQTVGAGFDQWIWSGLFYRCAAIAMCVRLGLARRFSAAVFVYLFVASLPLRLDAGFHAAPLVVFCLCLAGLLLQEAAVSGVRWRAIGVAACAVPLAVLAVAGGRYVSLHAFASDFGNLIEEARLMQQAARGRTDVRFGRYPAGDYMYYLTGLRPVSRFTDYYPWVADAGRSEMRAALASAPALVLKFDITGSVWGTANRATLADEIAYARAHLIQEQLGHLFVYVSPELAAHGQPVPHRAFPGVYRDGEWRLVTDLDDPEHAPRVYSFGGPGDVPVTGDWDGSGRTKIGVYRPARGEWVLDWNGNGALDSADRVYTFGGKPGDVPVTGDWDKSGRTKIGIYRPSTGEWLLDLDGDGTFDAARDRTFILGGAAGDRPVTGDWSGTGLTRVGVVQPDGAWMLDIDGDGRIEAGVDLIFYLGGLPGDIPVTGDWNGDGRTKAGLVQHDSWAMDADGDLTIDAAVSSPDLFVTFGGPSDRPVTGAW